MTTTMCPVTNTRTVSLTLIFFSLAHGSIPNFAELYKKTEDLIKLSKSYKRLENNDEYFAGFDSSKKPVDYGSFDFIIVGAGTAGGVMANRLSETNFKVLLVEAGVPDPEPLLVPAFAGYASNTPLDWGYKTTVQKNNCLATIDKRCIYQRGKVWGGSSSVNGNIYSRGGRWDYDTWAEIVGTHDWSYKKILPYFKKAERAMFRKDLDKNYHGFSGPQSVNTLEDTPGLTTTLLRGFKEKGLLELDYNGKSPYGISRVQTFSDRNIRSGTAHAYIRPAAHRHNLIISDSSLVTKVKIVNNRAVGVEFVKNGTLYFAQASKEIIVSAGSINTPQILMLSGIGPSQELKKHGINLVKDLPVGKNLKEHVSFPIFFRTNHTYYNLTLKEKLKLWYENKRPLTAAWGEQVISFKNLKNYTSSSSRPDVEFLGAGPGVASVSIATGNRFNKEYIAAYGILNKYTDFMLSIILLHPESKGAITLQSKDPRDYPLINLNAFAVEKDLETMYQAIKWLLEIGNTKAFRHFKAERLNLPMPGCDENYKIESRQWWYCALKHVSVFAYHAMGTAIMGTDPSNSVIDAELKVHGIRRLRVADASVFPVTISGHMSATVVMVAEKLSALINAEYKH